MGADDSEADRIRDTTLWSRRWLAMKHRADDVDQYGFIDALDVAGGEELLVRAGTADGATTRPGREPLDGESLPVIARFDSVDALLAAGWRVD